MALTIALVALRVPAALAVAASPLLGDINCDNHVDAADVTALTPVFFGAAACMSADTNADDGVSVADLVAVEHLLQPPLPTATSTITTTPSLTATITRSPTPSITATFTPSATASRTPSVTRTATITSTATRTNSATRTPSLTPTPSTTRTPSSTRTSTLTRTPSRTATGTPTATVTRTPSVTRTPTFTRTASITPSPTGTGTPTRSPTPTFPVSAGPRITFFGLTTADNHVLTPDATTDDGVPIYIRPSGSGFFIVVESKKGSGAPPGIQFSNSDPTDPTARPDLQIEANRDLGNGSAAVCDNDPRIGPVGGVPGINPPNFDPASQPIADALNDFGCRFQDNTDSPCTLNANDIPAFVKPDTTKQACTTIVLGTELLFRQGDTLVTVQWRDTAVPSAHIGFPQRLVIRVP